MSGKRKGGQEKLIFDAIAVASGLALWAIASTAFPVWGLLVNLLSLALGAILLVPQWRTPMLAAIRRPPLKRSPWTVAVPLLAVGSLGGGLALRALAAEIRTELVARDRTAQNQAERIGLLAAAKDAAGAGRVADAVRAYAAAEKLGPLSPEERSGYARSLVRQASEALANDQLDDAIAALRTAQVQDPGMDEVASQVEALENKRATQLAEAARVANEKLYAESIECAGPALNEVENAVRSKVPAQPAIMEQAERCVAAAVRARPDDFAAQSLARRLAALTRDAAQIAADRAAGRMACEGLTDPAGPTCRRFPHNIRKSDLMFSVEVDRVFFRRAKAMYSTEKYQYGPKVPMDGMALELAFTITNPYDLEYTVPIPMGFQLTSKSDAFRATPGAGGRRSYIMEENLKIDGKERGYSDEPVHFRPHQTRRMTMSFKAVPAAVPEVTVYGFSPVTAGMVTDEDWGLVIDVATSQVVALVKARR